MKKAIITLFLSFCCLFSFAQSFEGEIVYHNIYKSKMPSMTDDQIAGLMGSTQNYYIKGGDYKSVTNGSFMLWQLYINNDNKLYNKMANSEAVLWNDGVVNKDSVLSTELHPGVVEILGYKCDELVLNCKSGVQKYYFTSKLPIDGKLYANHLYGNWNVYASKTNAIPLKIIVETAQLTVEGIATAIKPMKLDASFFQLAPGIKTAPSPY